MKERRYRLFNQQDKIKQSRGLTLLIQSAEHRTRLFARCVLSPSFSAGPLRNFTEKQKRVRDERSVPKIEIQWM